MSYATLNPPKMSTARFSVLHWAILTIAVVEALSFGIGGAFTSVVDFRGRAPDTADDLYLLFMFAGAIVIASVAPVGRFLRIVLLGLVCIGVALKPFHSTFMYDSDRPPYEYWRWFVLAPGALAMAFELSWRGRRINAFALGRLILLILLFAILVVLFDWQVRVWQGRMPLFCWSPAIARETSWNIQPAPVSSPNGDFKISLAGESSFAITDKLGARTVVSCPVPGDGRISGMGVTDDGNSLLVLFNEAIVEYDLVRPEQGVVPQVKVQWIRDGSFRFADVFPDGRTVVAGSIAANIYLLDRFTGREIGESLSNSSTSMLYGLATAPDNTMFATWTSEGVKIWRRDSLACVRNIKWDSRWSGHALGFTRDGRFITAKRYDGPSAYLFPIHPTPSVAIGLLCGIILLGWRLAIVKSDMEINADMRPGEV